MNTLYNKDSYIIIRVANPNPKSQLFVNDMQTYFFFKHILKRKPEETI